ncbi:hypothetical protein D3C71_2136960 [compost metagenome]
MMLVARTNGRMTRLRNMVKPITNAAVSIAAAARVVSRTRIAAWRFSPMRRSTSLSMRSRKRTMDCMRGT